MGPQESCCRNAEVLHDAAQFHAIPFGLRGLSCLPPAGHHKRIVTGLLTYVKLTSLPKLFLGKRAAQKEGPQKSKKQSSLWNKVMSLARYCSMRCIRYILDGCIILIVVYCLCCSPKIQVLIILDAVQIYESLSCIERLLLCK